MFVVVRGALLACVLAMAGCVVVEDPGGPRGVVEPLPDPITLRLPLFLDDTTCIMHDGPVDLVGATMPGNWSALRETPSLVVVALRGDLVVNVSVILPDGQDGADAPGPGEADFAQPGGDGGSLVLLAPKGKVLLRHGAVQLGSGGDGGDVWPEGEPRYGVAGGQAGMFAWGGKELEKEQFDVHPGQSGLMGRDRGHEDAPWHQHEPYRYSSERYELTAQESAYVAKTLQGSCANIANTVRGSMPLGYD